jgi:hypothetical protein
MSAAAEPPASGSRVRLSCWPYGLGKVVPVDGSQALIEHDEPRRPDGWYRVAPFPFTCLAASEPEEEEST